MKITRKMWKAAYRAAVEDANDVRATVRWLSKRNTELEADLERAHRELLAVKAHGANPEHDPERVPAGPNLPFGSETWRGRRFRLTAAQQVGDLLRYEPGEYVFDNAWRRVGT